MPTILPEISVTIPAYNEENRLPKYLDSIIDNFRGIYTSYEIIIVDDGSTDSTSNIVAHYAEQNPNIKLIKLPQNHGKGFAVKTGMLRAKGKLRLFADSDGATPITELERLKMAIENGASVVVASRALKDNSCTIKARLHRKIIGSIFNFIVRTLTVKYIRDTQCGFKLFTAESASVLFPLQRIEGFGFDVEILFIADREGFRISEVPVNWRDVEGGKVRLIRDSYKMFCDVIRIRLNDFFGAYNHKDLKSK